MKKLFLSMAVLLGMLLTNSCHKDDADKNNDDREKISVTANISQGEVTKVDINPVDGALISVVWTPGDSVAVFGKYESATQGYLGKLGNETTKPANKAIFSGNITESVDEMYYVLYPNRSDYTFNATTGTVLPLNLASQTGTINGFSYLSNSMFMRAVGQKAAGAENIDFSMSRLCALLQFNLKLKEYKEGIKLKSIQISGASLINKKSYNIYDNILTDQADAGNSMALSFANNELIFSSDSLTVAMSAFPTEAAGDVKISVVLDNNGVEQTFSFERTMPLLKADKRHNEILEIELPEPETETIYVAGSEQNSSGINVAKVWKNDKVLYTLTNGERVGNAYCLLVSGSDVYVAGSERGSSFSYVAKVWKNEVAQDLTSGAREAQARSVSVSGSDVYAVGEELSGARSIAKVWKNGEELYPLTDGEHISKAMSVSVSGGDIYVAGYENTPSWKTVAKVWKNDKELYALTNGEQEAEALSISVSGSDVYVAGYEYNGSKSVAKVWKNEVELYALTNGDQHAQAKSVYLSGSDVYVTGYERSSSSKNIAKVWKNGKELYALTNGEQNAEALSVSISGSNVYVAGYESNVAKVWKNGSELYSLTNGENVAQAHSIYVKK